MNEPTPLELASPRPKPAMTPTVLAYRLRCLTDKLSRLAYAVPDTDLDTYAELMRARDDWAMRCAKRCVSCGAAICATSRSSGALPQSLMPWNTLGRSFTNGPSHC